MQAIQEAGDKDVEMEVDWDAIIEKDDDEDDDTSSESIEDPELRKLVGGEKKKKKQAKDKKNKKEGKGDGCDPEDVDETNKKNKAVDKLTQVTSQDSKEKLQKKMQQMHSLVVGLYNKITKPEAKKILKAIGQALSRKLIEPGKSAEAKALLIKAAKYYKKHS